MSLSRTISFDLMETCPISRSSSVLSNIPGLSPVPEPPTATPASSVESPSVSTVAPFVCDPVSSPLTPLMIQTDYISEPDEYATKTLKGKTSSNFFRLLLSYYLY